LSKGEVDCDSIGDFSTEVQKRISARLSLDIELQSPVHHRVQQFKERDEIALALPVGTNQDIQRAQIKLKLPDGFETC
jgi:hypothetical protein